LRDHAAWWFRLAQMLENLVDLSMRLQAMRTFANAVKRGNHPESDLDSQN
jgi:hypothetical protein